MRIKWHHYVLLAVFLLVFSARAFLASETVQFSDDSSYYTLSQVESIRDSGRLMDDSRSFLPFYFYFLAGIYVFLPKVMALKIFLNFFASTLVIAAYLIAFEVTQSKKVGILSALFAGFIPIYFQQTIHSLSVLSITLPLAFFSIYYLILFNKGKKMFFFFTKTEEKYAYHFLLCMLLLIIFSPRSILLIIGLLLFLLLAKLEGIKVDKANIEMLLVSLFFYFWFNFLFFKRAILLLGPQIIRQNLPTEFLSRYFANTTIYGAVYLIGIIPFLFGVYTAYVYIVRQKNTLAYILIGFTFSAFLFLWFKLVPLIYALIFLGAGLVLLLSLYFKQFFDYIEKTKVSQYSYLFLLIIIAIMIFTSLIPSIALAISQKEDVPTPSQINAYLWIKNNTEPEAVILASETEGNALSYFSNRKNFINDNFLFVKNSDQMVYDFKRIYVTRFSEEAVELLQKYGTTYIIVDEKIREQFQINDLFYRNDPCFSKIYDKEDVAIYTLVCKGGALE